MILVTGATGRLGTHLIVELSKKHKVRALVSKGKIKKMKNVEPFNGDILDKSSLEQAVQGVDTIYHLAAVTNYTASKKIMEQVNVQGTQNILEVVKALSAPPKIIYMSTTAVYGKKIAKLPATESTLCKPTNFYGQTKLKAERLAQKSGAIIIRSTDIYGPGFEEGYFFVFDKLKEQKLPIIGNGKNFIHYIHVSDVIQALLLANSGQAGQAYLVAGPDYITQEETYALACKFIGVNPPTKHISVEVAKMLARIYQIKAKIKKVRPELIPEYISKLASNRWFDISKARNELGFNPKVSYKQGTKEMVELWKSKKENQ